MMRDCPGIKIHEPEIFQLRHLIRIALSLCNILNITFVTLMYGVGVPILFPIAVASYTIIWSLERYQLAYTYQMPPNLDDTLIKNAINMLSLSPIFFILNGYWMLSNRQIFFSEVNKIDQNGTPMVTNHTVSTLFGVTPSTPMILIIIPFIIAVFMR